MIRHETLNPPPHIYPINEWKIIETSFYPRFLAQNETLFSVGNGYLGLRGNFEEGDPVFQNGTFINGFHETWPIVYGEKAYGFAKTGQTMLNVTDAKTIRLYVDDEPFYLPTASLMLFERILDMRAGTLEREVLWETPSGKQILIQSRRMVSLEHRHLAAISYQVTVLNASTPVVIASGVQGNQPNKGSVNDQRQSKGFDERVMTLEKQSVTERRTIFGHSVRNSGMSMACGVEHVFETECEYETQVDCGDDSAETIYTIDAEEGKPIQLVKFMSYHSSRRPQVQEMCTRSGRTLDRAVKMGFENLLVSQREFMDEFWRRSDVAIEEDPQQVPPAKKGELQQALRWNLFQILQASGRAEGTSIPAKGLSGQTYEGHYFWDTEIYVLPFLTYTAPRIARNILLHRYHMLDQARQRARELNHSGAMFPWRTINGEEASAYYAAGTAQYHINADIMYALKKYVEITGDKSFLNSEGAEMLVETARMWSDLGFFSESQNGQFCIHSVTGPDEYTTVVNNNTYTNLMARENLWYAARTVRNMQENYTQHFASLVHKTQLNISEIDQWQMAADRMYVPCDRGLGIHPQDDSFLDREVLDIANIPRDKFPLLLHFHPLVIYRHQVIKQADVVLAMFLLGDEFSAKEKESNFRYYDPLTTGDSSLSACIQSIIAGEVGDGTRQLKYARYAILMDLADVGGNVHDGCHIASMGGTWMAAVYGFAGMRDYEGQLSFEPRLPSVIEQLRFPLQVRGQELVLEIRQDSVTYLLREGDELALQHFGQDIVLKKNEPLVMEIEAPPEEVP